MFAALAIALIGCAVFAAGRIERDTAVDAGRNSRSAQGLLSAVREQESGARGFFIGRQKQFLAPWYQAVLVGRDRRIPSGARSAIHEAAAQAAPILANQRNLELAEHGAVSDALTGLPNRRAADETIRRMAALSGRSLNPLAVIMLDLDRFKQLKDEHGDRALTLVGEVLTATIRASDFAARYGGEEFLLLLPETDRNGAVEVAEKIRRAIERIELPRGGALTASFGVAGLPEDAVEPGQLLRRADRALYAAKARGRNRVEAAEPSGFGGLGGLPSG